MPSFSAMGEGAAAALNLAPVLWGMHGGQGIDGKATAGPKCCTKHLDLRTTQVPWFFIPEKIICTHKH